jgi:hypothetical protein
MVQVPLNALEHRDRTLCWLSDQQGQTPYEQSCQYKKKQINMDLMLVLTGRDFLAEVKKGSSIATIAA